MIFKNKTELLQNKITSSDSVLDIGFYGQGVSHHDENWVHGIVKKITSNVFGIDLEVGDFPTDRYKKASAEDFSFDQKFDVILAGDLIEHLSNPGKFLDACARCIKKDGTLVITTPNCFNLFNLAEKLTKYEPTVNYDHTVYFNTKTLKQLLKKNGWDVVSFDYVYSLGVKYKESYKKRFLNGLYWLLSTFTDKFSETVVVTARYVK